MTSVALAGFVLDEALLKLEDLAGDIDSARITASALVPPQLTVPTLATTGVLGQVPTWLREQKIDPIKVLRDLAYLLDETGSTVEFTQTGTDLLADARTEIGEIYAERIAELGDIDSTADREAAEEMLEGFSEYAEDPEVSAAMLNALGPEGLNDALYRLQGLIYTGMGEEPNYGDYGDRTEEVEALKRLQDLGADVLARATASASTAGLLDPGYGTEFVEADARGWGVATLFQYADKAGVALGTDFLVDAGEAILQREQELGGADSWYESMGVVYDQLPFGTDQGDDAVMNDPGLQWLQALDSNPAASQIIFADEGNAEYLLGERDSMYEDPAGQAAGRALKAATTDLALAGTTEQQRTAAEIASHVVEHFGGDEGTLLDGADEGVATMISTYINDMDRVITRTDGTPGVYDINDPNAPPLPSWLDPSSVPQFGIGMDLDDLRGLLKEVGDNEDAIATISSTAGRYDQIRMGGAAGDALLGPGNWTPQGQGDPFLKAVNESAEFQGFLTDAMYNGDIDDAQALAAHRQQVASLMTLPIDYFVKIPGAGEAVGDVLKDPIGAFLYGQLKTGATNELVGDGVSEAMASGNANWDINRGSVRLQALYALMSAQSDDPSSNPYAQPQADGSGVQFDVGADIRDAWPTSGGQPIPPGNLDAEEIERILDLAEQGTGYAPAAGSTVDGAFDNHAEHWSGN